MSTTFVQSAPHFLRKTQHIKVSKLIPILQSTGCVFGWIFCLTVRCNGADFLGCLCGGHEQLTDGVQKMEEPNQILSYLWAPGEITVNLHNFRSHPSLYTRSSITDVTISFNNGIRYIAQSTDGQQGQCLRAQQMSHRNLASLIPRLTANRLELRIHNIEFHYSDLRLNSVNTQVVDIKFCRQIGNGLKSHVEALLSELALNRSVKKVSISSEVAQREATLPKDIFEIFESNNIELDVNI
ncbi:hypothetical protein ANCCAN_23908 [Ancylostoma caninum]|uniref:Uncharacterized protein n=1 Tax=Ancylostoma caninum TaxID=29170 RepID=A0A368FJH3_ANCCA|nr:hypothetical protein ANCCAN_23908 [Ancylostoma caninum]